MANPLLGPVLVLALWTHVIWAWMYATRLPAMRAAKMRPDSNALRGEQVATLPPRVRWKADNYNHLMEQPTVFYAVALAMAVAGDQTSISTMLAWTYVGLRIVHSLVQVLVNIIQVRFLIFFVSSLVLVALTIRGVLAVF